MLEGQLERKYSMQKEKQVVAVKSALGSTYIPQSVVDVSPSDTFNDGEKKLLRTTYDLEFDDKVLDDICSIAEELEYHSKKLEEFAELLFKFSDKDPK